MLFWRFTHDIYQTSNLALLETMSLPRPAQPVENFHNTLSTSQDLLVSKVTFSWWWTVVIMKTRQGLHVKLGDWFLTDIESQPEMVESSK